MAVIPVPSVISFQNIELECEAVSQQFVSSFNGKRQSSKKPFDVWSFQGDLVSLDPAKVGAVRSFLMQLAGRTHTFRLKIAGSRYPISGYTGANGTANTAGQSGTTATASGMSINTKVLSDGDYFNIGDELKVAVGDVTTNASGIATFVFMPPLRRLTTTAPATAFTITDPFLYLRASGDKVAKWKVTAPTRHAIKLEAEEEI